MAGGVLGKLSGVICLGIAVYAVLAGLSAGVVQAAIIGGLATFDELEVKPVYEIVGVELS
jgi:hypothetical protein